MDKKFFKIVGIFSFGVAALTLVISLILLLYSGTQYFGSANEKVTVSDVDLKSYKKALKENKAEAERLEKRRAEQEKARESGSSTSQAPEEKPTEIELVAEKMCEDIKHFAEKTDQSNPNCNYLANMGDHFTNAQGYKLGFKQFNKLAKDMKSLAKQADKIAKEDKDSVKYIDWIEYLDWYEANYLAQVENEYERIDTEISDQFEAQMSSMSTIIAAAVAFFMFVFFTLILILVKIEENTRTAKN